MEDQRLRTTGIHGSVPTVEKLPGMHGGLDGPGRNGHPAQPRQERPREQRNPILLQGTEALHVVAAALPELLHDALRPIPARPLEREVVRVAIGHDPVVRGDDGAARWVVDPGKLVEGNESLPVVACIPPRPRHRAGTLLAVAAPNRNQTGSDVPDVSVHVGVGDVLLRGMEVARVGDEALPVPRVREPEAGLQGEVVFAQRGPREREHSAGAGMVVRCAPGIIEDRAMPGLAHLQRHVLAVLDPNALAAHVECAPAVRGEIARGIGRIDLFDEQVLNVRAGIGEAPCNVAVVPEHHHRHAGEGRAHGVHAGPREMHEIPDRRRGEPEVGIVREQRLAGHAPRPVDHPAIGAGVASGGR